MSVMPVDMCMTLKREIRTMESHLEPRLKIYLMTGYVLSAEWEKTNSHQNDF